MSRSRGSRQSPMRERKPPLASKILQGKTVNDESLDLFSWLRKKPNPVPPSNHDNVTGQPGGVQGTNQQRIVSRKFETDDLLSPEVGKNEFNWLLTPPASPLHPIFQQPSSSSTAQKEMKQTAPKVKARSISASRPSRLSQETSNSTITTTKMVRSSSVTRSSRRSSLPNTIMTRSSSSGTLSTNRASSLQSTTTKPSLNSTSKLPSSLTRPSGASSRPPSPAKTRNTKTAQTPLPERPRSSPNAPPAYTPRMTISPRLPTPPRRATSSGTQPPLTVPRSSSLSRLPSQETKNMGSSKIRKPAERPVSTVKQGMISARSSVNTYQRPATSPASTPRKNMARSQVGESLGKSRLGGVSQGRKGGLPTDAATARKSFKQVPAIDQSIISRTRLKKMPDANTKQTDTQQGGGDHRRAPIYPRSNSSRLPATRNRTEVTSRSSGKIVPTDDSTSSDRGISDDGSMGPLSDIFESTRYDFLLKEDATNLSWLRGDDEVSLRCPSFHRFDLPPEPFGQ